MSIKSIVFQNPTLRLIGAALLLLGIHNASVYPYQSLIAIERIGLSKPAFSAMLVMASVSAVSASVLFGIWGDQRNNRRLVALLATASSATGLTLMLAIPSQISLLLCHGILLPIATSLYGQLFTLARLAGPEDPAQRDRIQGFLRSAMSLSFLAVLLFWTFVFGAGADVMAVYLSAGAASYGLLLLIYLSWPKDGATPWKDQPSGLKLSQAFAEIARPRVLLRLLLLGAISASGVLYMVLISLIFDASPVRSTSDVALYVGMVAGWEVPCLILLPRLTARMRRTTLLAAGSVLYSVQLIALPLLCDSPLIWGMTLLAGVGGAAIIAVPIGYYQDLLRDRPGVAGSMLALQKLVSDALGAGAFAIGTAWGGYEAVALIGVTLALAGAAVLHLADRPVPQTVAGA